jgi:hypothetical protein
MDLEAGDLPNKPKTLKEENMENYVAHYCQIKICK